ncbi:MAG TPA: acyltransferase [Mucilaginibacter sp.]|jgi:peptidoglycan/LPS O-acetylase OafA/YrhL|nr:acyltransferase [Mucilaginibacter sp.]
MRSELKYIPGLDGIRALAAFLVISTHWPNNMLSLKFGWIGVNIFFVLSGFLITRILLNEKQNHFKDYISTFYYKRFLRIFPLYYAFLCCAFVLILLLTFLYPSLLNYQEWKSAYNATKHDFIYYLTYTYNIKINLRYFIHFPDSSNRFFGHLWSLSLEEQFYILFPLLVYFASLKILKRIVIAVIIICPLIRLWGVFYGAPMVSDSYWFGELFYSNTFLQADALCTGAALAIFDIKQAKPYITFFITGAAWLGAGIFCFYFLRKTGYFLVPAKSLGYDFPGFWFGEKTPYWFINIRPFYQYTLVNILAAALVLPAINGKLLFPKVFANKGVAYLGKISYGIYIFHNPLLALFIILAEMNWGGWGKLTGTPLAEITCFVIYVGVVIAIAHLSYQYFEKRILKYKYALKPAPVNA